MQTVDIENLLKNPDRVLNYEAEWEPTNFDLREGEARVVEPVEVEFVLRNESARIVADGTASTRIELTCGRCLDPYEEDFRTDVSAEYVDPQEEHEEPYEQKVFVLEIQDKHVNLAEPVRQDLVLTIPMQPLCREDCASLCPVCGINLNHESCDHDQESVDPRLEALQDIEITDEDD